MKKSLLLSGLLLSALSAFAVDQPKSIMDAAFQGISPNGRYLASSLYGTVVIYDLVNGVEYTYTQDETGMIAYSEGLGNYVSNTGVVLGSTSSNSDAAYWENGEWHNLSVINPELSNLSNGITPDGSRICGSIGVAPVSTDGDNLMLTPAYWDRNADGTYGEYHLLPAPALDFTGRVPQYITALSISENGKTIAGQIIDCFGGIITPIVYTEDEEGKWSYKTLCDDLINPDHLQFPPVPGPDPKAPNAKSYLSEEELAAYNAAVEEWNRTHQGDYPQYTDFMSEDAKAEYDALFAIYQTEYNEWFAKFEAFQEVYFQILDVAPVFQFNNGIITPDGSQYYTTSSVDDMMTWSTTYTPWSISIPTGEAKAMELEKSMQVSQVIDNNTFLACTEIMLPPMEGFVVTDGVATSVQDFMLSRNPELASWIEENLYHNVETGWDPETGESIFENLCITGVPHASADLTTLTFWNDAYWEYGTITSMGYIANLSPAAGVKDIVVAGDKSVAFDAAGNLSLKGDITELFLFDLSGRCVLSVKAPGESVSCNLPSGVYVVKAMTTEGSFASKIAK